MAGSPLLLQLFLLSDGSIVKFSLPFSLFAVFADL